MPDRVLIFIQNPPEIYGLIRRLGRANEFLEGRNQATVEAFTDLSIFTVKQKALALPVQPPRDRGLRRRLSRGVGRRKIDGGYRVTTSAPFPGMVWYPREVTNQWQHPTFGGPPIVTQREDWQWFLEPIAQFHEPMEMRLRDNIRDTVDFIAG